MIYSNFIIFWRKNRTLIIILHSLTLGRLNIFLYVSYDSLLAVFFYYMNINIVQMYLSLSVEFYIDKNFKITEILSV